VSDDSIATNARENKRHQIRAANRGIVEPEDRADGCAAGLARLRLHGRGQRLVKPQKIHPRFTRHNAKAMSAALKKSSLRSASARMMRDQIEMHRERTERGAGHEPSPKPHRPSPWLSSVLRACHISHRRVATERLPLNAPLTIRESRKARTTRSTPTANSRTPCCDAHQQNAAAPAPITDRAPKRREDELKIEKNELRRRRIARRVVFDVKRARQRIDLASSQPSAPVCPSSFK